MKRAFTLIEVMVVVAIVAIAAGLIIPAIQKAKNTVTTQELEAVGIRPTGVLPDNISVIKIDGCEYILINNTHGLIGIIHKANCWNVGHAN